MNEILRVRKSQTGDIGMRVVVVVFACLIAAVKQSPAQAKPTAVRALDVQLGGMFNVPNPDYGNGNVRGFEISGTFDWKRNLGIEVSTRSLFDGNNARNLRLRSFEIGPRYVFHTGPWSPYAKLLYGRGYFQFPPVQGQHSPAAQLPYNFAAAGAGVDYALRPSVNVRVDYEYQVSRSAGIANVGAALGLSQVLDVTVAENAIENNDLDVLSPSESNNLI